MNTGYDLNNPNKYMQTAFDAFKSNQPATQQAVSQGPQAGLRYLAGLQAQANQQQAQQAQPQALPSTTVLQQLLQKLGQNHGIMAQLPASIDIASAPTQPAMATGGVVSLAAGGPIAFSGGDTVPEPDFDASYNEPEEMTLEERMTRRNPEYEQWSEQLDTAAERNRSAEERLWRRTPKYEPPKHEAIGPPRPTDSWTGEPLKTSGTGEGIFSRAGKAIAEHPITKGIGKALPHMGIVGLALDPHVRAATKAPMILAKSATGTPLSADEAEAIVTGADPISAAHNGIQAIRPSVAAPFVGPIKPTESPVHEPVAKAEPIAAAKEGVKAVSATEHAKQIEKKAEAPKGKEPQGAVPEEKQYEFDQHRDEYRDDHQPQGQTVSQPTDRAYAPAPEASGIASVTPEDMIQHLQRLGGGGYQEDPEVSQMRNEQLESAKANKWANSIAGLIGGIYGGHSPYASENVARGIMTALGQYQAGTQAEDAIRSGIMGSKESAQKSQASYQQHLLDKFIEAQLAKGRDQASIMREMISGDTRLGAAETRAKAAQEAAQQRHIDAVARSNQSRSATDQKLAVETAKAALNAVDDYVKNYSRGVPSEDDKKRVFLTMWHKLAPRIPITDEEVASMLGSPPPTGSPGNPTATYGSSSSQVPYDED